jgi:eukaryotic-like serine/threonine-protein kinase
VSATLPEGTILGDEFEIVRPIGAGGMGAVYEARQRSTGALRAVKTMHAHIASDGDFRTRFEQEARVAAKIASDHVVQVLAAGVDAKTGMPWIALELLHGTTLGDRLRKDVSLPPADVLEIYRQVCHGLAAAHRAGIVHRDLKPENLFLADGRRAGERWCVKILDFGIAKLLAGSAHSTASLGTPMWMAPEQATRGAGVSPATDIWSMGLIVFDALTGYAYWRSVHDETATAAALLTEILVHDLEPASTRAKEYGVSVPAGFDAWFAKCVTRDPTARFQDVDVAYRELSAVLRDAEISVADTAVAPIVARSQGTVDVFANTNATVPTAKPRRTWLAGVAALIVVGGAALALRARKHETPVVAAPSAPAPPTMSVSTSASTPPQEHDDHAGMVRISGGTFSMGSNDGPLDEQPIHDASVAGFMLDVNLVTVAQYQKCVDSGKCTPAGTRARCNAKAGRADHPINCVTFAQARAYCSALGKRLPTEEEWELAARGRARRKYPWGDKPPSSTLLCWNKTAKDDTTCPVGAFPSGATPEGVFDMAGNLWEWTATSYCTYANPACNEERKVTRGGAFVSSDPVIVRASTRMGQEPTIAGASIGFRCADTE